MVGRPPLCAVAWPLTGLLVVFLEVGVTADHLLDRTAFPLLLLVGASIIKEQMKQLISRGLGHVGSSVQLPCL